MNESLPQAAEVSTMETEADTNETADSTVESTVESKNQPTLQDVSRKYFGPEALESGQTYVNQAIELASVANADVSFNFEPEEGIPEGYGIAVVPQTKRVAERGNQVVGITIAAIPAFTKVIENESGQNWVQKKIIDVLVQQIASAAKPKQDDIISLPFKVEDFITSARQSGLAAFNAVATAYVKALKDKGLKYMSKILLRQILASKALAEQQFPKIAQENWEIVIKSMIDHAKKEGHEAGVLSHWLKTRNEVEIDTSDIDLADLDELV